MYILGIDEKALIFTLNLVLSLSFNQATVYLYDTADSSSVEFYDCMSDKNGLAYCRRSVEPIALMRTDQERHCYYDGTPHLFTSLVSDKISISTVLYQWKSSIEKAEEYARFTKQLQSNESLSNDENYLCECKHPQSFGKNCEYLLPIGTTFEETLDWQIGKKADDPGKMQLFGDIVCYTTVKCNYGLLCLDWRNICDRVQNCMAGVDEENCDKLEFNECEDDEYRCTNGMCVPDEYFLDGEYDCMDLSDEKRQFNDTACAFQQANNECDERLCSNYHWSCGDGQCIRDRLDFQSLGLKIRECESQREQYYMCEMHGKTSQWTLPNGKCYHSSPRETAPVTNRTPAEECIYFVKCALSEGADENCPCKYNPRCTENLQSPCRSNLIRYPRGAAIAPFIFTYYHVPRDWSNVVPDEFLFDGVIKCRGYMLDETTRIEASYWYRMHDTETEMCKSQSGSRELAHAGYDQYCYNNSRTFTNRSYHFIDVCNVWKECISAYRIRDGFFDCTDGKDERRGSIVQEACSNVQRHRFRCSSDEPSCLSIQTVGDQQRDCDNNYDVRWMGIGDTLSELVCAPHSKRDCRRLRQYIEASTRIFAGNSSYVQPQSSQISFHSFCDSFFNSVAKKDENTLHCQHGWRCRYNEWQCHTGQCIPTAWVLDGEWDCADASEEQALFASGSAVSAHNSKLMSMSRLQEKFIKLYSRQPFGRLCNLTTEYPCLRMNASDPLDIERYRPCINLEEIGNGHVDCFGGRDERNNIERCGSSVMLGNFFQCPGEESCKPYELGCFYPCRDSRVQCFGYQQNTCMGAADFLCFDGTCLAGAWCNEKNDCYYGEDE